jgi:hypothetical protein
VRHFGTKTNRLLDNSAPQLDKSAPQKDKSALAFFSLILCTKLPVALNQFQILIMSVPEKILMMRTILLHCIQLSSDIVKLKEVFLPHPFYHVSGFYSKFSQFLNKAHALVHRGSQLYFHIARYMLKRRREDTFWGAKSESRVSELFFASKTVVFFFP